MRKIFKIMASGLLFGCASTGIIDFGTNATDFYYLANFDEDVYYDQGKGTHLYITRTVTPNVISPVTLEKKGRNPNHYWPLATSELHSDIRNLFTIQVMHTYMDTYDFSPPLDWDNSPKYKPFANYGSRISIADELKDLDGIDTSIGYHSLKLDDKTMLLLLKALELKFAGNNAIIDYHSNQCFAGFTPADQKRSGLNSPATRYTCEQLFQSLRRYIPIVNGEIERPTLDYITHGPVFVDFKFVQGLDKHSQIKAFFEDDRVSNSDKSELAQRFLKQLDPVTAIHLESFKRTFFKPVLVGDDHYTYTVSANPKYLYDSDPARIQHFLYFDSAMSHDFLQMALLGLSKISPVRYSGQYSPFYEAAKGQYQYLSVAPITEDNRFARNIYPTPLVKCLHNRRHQSVSLPKVSRMAYYCSTIDSTARDAKPDPYNKPLPEMVDDSEHITGLTVYLNNRLTKPTPEDNYSTTFYKVNPEAPIGVREKLIEKQIPNAFVGRVVKVDGVVYGYVHHQGVAYYIFIDELVEYLESFI